MFLLLYPSAIPHEQARETSRYSPLHHTFTYGAYAHHPHICECYCCVRTHISSPYIRGACDGCDIRVHPCDSIHIRGVGFHWQLYVGSG